MARTCTTAILALSLSLASATPARAQDERFAGFDGPRGANLTLNLRMPLGGRRGSDRATLGLTAGYGRTFGSSDVDGRTAMRQLTLADVRVARNGLDRAQLASFDLADGASRRRLGFDDYEDNKKSWWIVAAFIGLGLAFLTIGGGSSRDRTVEPTPPPSTPGG